MTPLYTAASLNATAVYEALISSGADANIQNNVSEIRYSQMIITRFTQSITFIK
jgi:hypothetical protein